MWLRSMKFKKKTYVTALIFSAVMALSACSEKPAAEEPTEQATNSVSEAEQATDASIQETEPVEESTEPVVQEDFYVIVGGEEISWEEFSFGYSTLVNNYVMEYSDYLSWFGLDLEKDFAAQYYSEGVTWEDYFEEMTLDALRRNKALKADAKANGFEKDVSLTLSRMEAQLREGAEDAGMSLDQYLEEYFGIPLTMSAVHAYLEEALFVNAYYSKLSSDFTPAAEKVVESYKESSQWFDYADYKIRSFDQKSFDSPEQALEQAELAKKTIRKDGDLVTGITYDTANDFIRGWLFEDGRKEGDVTIIEDTEAQKYYCLAFEKRYRNETKTADIRLLMAETEDEAINMYETWKAGGATEAYFEELCDGDYLDNSISEGGLLEGISRDEDLYSELLTWIFAKDRKPGDCEVVNVPDVASFILYYVCIGDPVWYRSIEYDLREADLSEYVGKLVEACEVSDPYGHFHLEEN